jgi:hypothetical protein
VVGRLATFACIVATSFACYITIGTGAMYVGLALATALGDPLAWSVYGMGIAIAVSLAFFAPRMVDAVSVPRWLARTVTACTALLVCQQFAVAGTPDWSPVPLLVAIAVSFTSAVVVWVRTGEPLNSGAPAQAYVTSSLNRNTELF